MWQPGWISPLPLQHKKSGELWNTGSSVLNWKWTWKGHPTAQIIFTTAKNRSKSRKKCPFFVKHSIKLQWRQQFASHPAASVLIFCQKFFPWCYFFSEVSSGSVAQLLSGRTPEQAAPAFWSPHRWWPSPFHCFFFSFPWPNTITSRRLIPCSTQTDLVLGAKLLQKRCALGGLPDGGFCSSPWSVSSSICQNVSSNEVLLARRA